MIKIVYPPRDVVEAFNNHYFKMGGYIEHKERENDKLSEIRATLISNLINV